MASTIPIAAKNQWSCALACTAWLLTENGIAHSQDDLLYKFGVYYPEWIQRPGLLTRGDLLSLLTRAGLQYRQFHHLSAKDEVLRTVSSNVANYLGGFAFTRKPTNHCMAIVSWTGDLVNLMDPNPQSPAFGSMSWDDLFTKHDADILWLFKQ